MTQAAPVRNGPTQVFTLAKLPPAAYKLRVGSANVQLFVPARNPKLDLGVFVDAAWHYHLSGRRSK
jgi:hypothetical protein